MRCLSVIRCRVDKNSRETKIDFASLGLRKKIVMLIWDLKNCQARKVASILTRLSTVWCYMTVKITTYKEWHDIQAVYGNV